MAAALAGRTVLLGVSGGIAAYKAASLARLLVTQGARVRPVMTRGASEFLGAATLEGICGEPVQTDVWDDIAAGHHVTIGRSCDVAIVYPATAHTLARLAHGLADDLLTTTLLATTAPVILAPAMHTEMWEHAATKANVHLLTERGNTIIGPEEGALMGHDVGAGRLVSPEAAYTAVYAALNRSNALAGTHIVITAGGTREALDAVRYLGNRSSGRMGFALAEQARRRGATVTLIAAPSSLATPPGVSRIDVVSAEQMHDAVFDTIQTADVIIKAAAVADFRPETALPNKWKKSSGTPDVTLVPNPDILRAIGTYRDTHPATPKVLVGFAAETDDLHANAQQKLTEKNVDLLVANDVSQPDAGFDVDTNRVVVFDRDGSVQELDFGAKTTVAATLLDLITAKLKNT